MSALAGEHGRDQQQDQHHAPPPPQKADALPELTHEPSVEDIVRIVRANPARRDPIMTALHQRMGNGFVQEVVVALAAPLPGAIALHPEAQSKTDAILKSNAGALDKGRLLAEVAHKNLSDLNSQFVPGYKKARDQLDAEAVKELGHAVVMSLQLSRAASMALADQLALVKPQDQAGADVEIEGAEAAQSESLRFQLDMLRRLIPMCEFTALTTLTPMVFRGAAISPEAPVVDEATIEQTLQDEVARTVRAINFVERTTSSIMFTKGDSAAKQARQGLGQFHRPVDLELVRAGLRANGVWDMVNASDAAPHALEQETCSERGPAQDMVEHRETQAAQTGWLTDTGEFDTETMRAEIREGTSASAIKVYQMIMTAKPDGRARALEEIQRDGKLDFWLSYLPWRKAKSLHDALPHGNAAIKSKLQAVFQKEGAWGTDLVEEQYHAPSLTKMFHDDISTNPQNAPLDYVVDEALNIASLDFMHSYGKNEDAYAAGEITERDYNRTRNEVSDHTTHEAAVMMATGEAGELVPELEEGASVTRKMVAGGVEAGTFAAGGEMAVDALDVESGAKSEMNMSLGYLGTFLLAGGITAGLAGAGALLGKRGRNYLPGGKTLAQHLADVNPELAKILGAAGKGATVEIRVSVAEIEALEKRGVIDAASAGQLRAASTNGGGVRATVHVTGELDQPGQRAFAVTAAEADAAIALKPRKPGTVSTDSLPYITNAKQLPRLDAVKGVAIGRRIATEQEGQAILDDLRAGGTERLRELGFTGAVKPGTREWTLVQGSDGFALYAGGGEKVETPAGLEIAGHTHPTHIDGAKVALNTVNTDGSALAPTWPNVESSGRTLGAHSQGLIPSAPDFEATGVGGQQTVHTPFMQDGDHIVAAPDGAGPEGRINIEISDVKEKKLKIPDGADYYEATLTATTTGDNKTVWTQKAYAKRYPNTDGKRDWVTFSINLDQFE